MKLTLLSVVYVFLSLGSFTAQASAESGEVGLSLSLSTEIFSLHYPGTINRQLQGRNRLGANVAYGLSNLISAGLSASTSFASFANSPFSLPAALGTREIWSEYKDLILSGSSSVSLARKGMVFFQAKLDLGVQYHR